MKRLFFTAALILLASAVLNAFEVKERIYPADVEVTLHLRACSKWALEWIRDNSSVQGTKQMKDSRGRSVPPVGYCLEDHSYTPENVFTGRPVPRAVNFKVSGNEVVIKLQLKGENMHYIVFSKPPAPPRNRWNRRVVKLLTLDAETFKLRPFKGNLHQHSTVSDGRFAPEEHAAFARLAGFDYVAVSDHARYDQNAPVMKTAAESKSGLSVYPAEELHTPGGVLHGLSIGGTKGHSFLKNRTPEWLKEVKPLHEELIKKYPKVPHAQLLSWAESLLVARRARADGALVVYCHPAWRKQLSRNNSIEMGNFIMRQKEFDVIEVINGTMGGKTRRENMESLAIYTEVCAETGFRKPVMSSSDSHNVSHANYARNYNIIFAPDCTFPSFKAAFLEGRAVAAFDIDPSEAKNSPQPLFWGRSSFVRYANFLDEIGYWKKHDDHAQKQGALLQKFVKGDKTVVPRIEKIAGELELIRNGIYYKPGK